MYLLAFPLHLNIYVMGLRPLKMLKFFQCGDRLYTSRSDVYRRQILTYKDGPRIERVKVTSQQYRDVETMLVECLASVTDDGPAFNQHCSNVSCLLG